MAFCIYLTIEHIAQKKVTMEAKIFFIVLIPHKANNQSLLGMELQKERKTRRWKVKAVLKGVRCLFTLPLK